MVPHRGSGRTIAILLACLASMPAGAQRLDSLLVLPLLTVSATRTASEARTAPVRVAVLDTTALRLAGRQNLAEILEHLTLAAVRRYGPTGLASASVRGSGAGQTVVLLDGIPIQNPQLGQLDLSLVPLAWLEAAELRYGAGSAYYGAGAMGGVIHLKSAGPKRSGFHGTARLLKGAYGRAEASTFLQASSRGAALALAVEAGRERGDFPYLNTALFPPATVARLGADRQNWSIFTSLALDRGTREARLSAWVQEAERGLPASAYQEPTGERQWDREMRLWGRWLTTVPGGQVTGAGSVQRMEVRYAHPGLGIDETGAVWSGSADMDLRLALTAAALLQAGVSAGAARVDHPSVRNGAVENHLAAFGGLTLELGPALLYPSLRMDHHMPVDGAARTPVSPSLGVSWGPLERLRVKAQVARSFRMPTLNDRYWAGVGDPNLRPESGWSEEWGLSWLAHALEMETTWYHSRIRDRIVWEPLGTLWRPLNLDDSRVYGMEATARRGWEVGERSRLDGTLLYGWTETASPEGTAARALRYVPRHQLKADAGFRWRSLEAGVSSQFVGTRYVTEDRTETVPAFATVSGRVAFARVVRGSRLRIELLAENLTDGRYAFVRGYPMPPRHLAVRTDLSF